MYGGTLRKHEWRGWPTTAVNEIADLSLKLRRDALALPGEHDDIAAVIEVADALDSAILESRRILREPF